MVVINILIIGCGKVGARLSNKLSELGHSVAVVDHDPEQFRNLAPDFPGYTVTGVAIDQDVLRRGGIENCDALAAVTEDDNTNIMVAQLASAVFQVPQVLTRIFDPRRGDVFSQFGLHTVCPTNLSVDAMLSMLTGRQTQKTLYFDAATVSFEILPAAPKQVGRTIAQLQQAPRPQQLLFGLLHEDGNLTLAQAGSRTAVLPGDRLIYAKVVD